MAREWIHSRGGIVQETDNRQWINSLGTIIHEAINSGVGPVITNRREFRLVPETYFSIQLTANEMVSWSKDGGVDSALFTLVDDMLTLGPQLPNVVRTIQIKATGSTGSTNATISVATIDRKRRSRGI